MSLPRFRAVMDWVTGPSHSGSVPKSMCCCSSTSAAVVLGGLLTRTKISPAISSAGMMMSVRIVRLDIVSIFVFFT